MKTNMLNECYVDASPLMQERVIAFLKALGIKKAKKRAINIAVRSASNFAPLKDGGLSAARIIHIELKKVSSARFTVIMNQWRDLPDDEEIDEDDCIIGDNAFVTGKLDMDMETIYRLDNGGFMVLQCENDEEPNIRILLYRDYAAICFEYSSRIIDAVPGRD